MTSPTPEILLQAKASLLADGSVANIKKIKIGISTEMGCTLPEAQACIDAILLPPPTAPVPEADGFHDYYNYVSAIGRPGDTLCFVAIEHNLDGIRAQETVINDFVSYEEALTRATFDALTRANNTASKKPRNTMSSIYVAMNTFPKELIGKRTGRTQENVVEVRAVQADVDYNGAATMDAIKSSGLLPPPSIVVESSTGKFQGVWLVDSFTKDEAKPLMQAMAAQFNTDSAVADIARVMRVPGFVNRKYDAAPIAKTVSQTNARYTRDKFTISTTPVREMAAKPENWVNDVVITHGNAYNDLLSLAGYYVRQKNMNDPDMLYRMLSAHCEDAVEHDGKTPWQPNMKQVREYAQKWAAEFETKEQYEARTNLPLTQTQGQSEQKAITAGLSSDAILSIVKNSTFNPFDANKTVGVDYHYEGCLVRGQMVVWAAPTKGKKSSFALLKAMCDACGADWYNFRNVSGPLQVFYLDTENSKGDLYERFDEYLLEFNPEQQKLILANLQIVFGKEIGKASGMELELHNTALWDVLQSRFVGAAVVYLDCWYDLHDAKDSDAKTQKAALNIVLQRFKGKSLFIVQHIGRDMLENLTKKNNAALRYLGGPRYINRIAQSFVLARKAEAFILQEPFELKDEDDSVTEEVIDLQIWGRSTPKLPMLTFKQVPFHNDREYNFRHEIDTSLSKAGATLLTRLKNGGPWKSYRALLKDATSGYGGKQKTALDELRFKGYLSYQPDGIRLKPMSGAVLLSAAQQRSAKKDADAFLERVLLPSGIPNDGLTDEAIRQLAEAEGVLLGGPLMYRGVQPATIDGKTVWQMVRSVGKRSSSESETLQAEVARLTEEEPSISKKELARRLGCERNTINRAIDALQLSKATQRGVWMRPEQPSQPTPS
jgi:hypothetical protein